jgi:hypothetical protein
MLMLYLKVRYERFKEPQVQTLIISQALPYARTLQDDPITATLAVSKLHV